MLRSLHRADETIEQAKPMAQVGGEGGPFLGAHRDQLVERSGEGRSHDGLDGGEVRQGTDLTSPGFGKLEHQLQRRRRPRCAQRPGQGFQFL